MKNNQQSILFASFEFEKAEQRGIAYYAKSLVKNTKDLGYKNYLLTSAKSNKSEIIETLNIYKQLTGFSQFNLKGSISKYQIVLLLIKYLKRILIYGGSRHITISQDLINGIREISYLHNIDFFLNESHIYDLISLHTRLLDSPYYLKLPNYPEIDIIISTAPINIRVSPKIKLVQTLHDIIPLSSLLCAPDDLADIFYKRIKNTMIYSDMILSVSDFSKQEVAKLFPEYAHKIVTTYQPVPIYPEESRQAEDLSEQKAVLAKYQLREQDYLLFIGTLEKRKNIIRIVEAYLSIKKDIDIPLVLVGVLGYGKKELLPYLNENKWGDAIKYLKYIPTVDKLILLKKARAFIFPSGYEGFGLPPLEAMQMGCPVLTSNVSSLPEVCGDAALYINPFDLNDLAKGMLEITTNETLRQNLIAKGYDRVKEFSMDKYRQRLGKFLVEVTKSNTSNQ